MNIIETQNLFVRNFIYRNKRDRVLLEITNTKRRQDFLLKLNHQILDIINNDLLTKVDDNTVDLYKSVCQDLKVNGEYKVLIISNYKEIDGKIKSFYEAFEDLKKFGGFASMLVFENGEKIYIKAEQSKGAPIKYKATTNSRFSQLQICSKFSFTFRKKFYL